jgi:arsenite oxidase small subunit
MMLASQFTESGMAEELMAEVAAYERKKVASLSDLKVDTPVAMFYPFDASDLNSLSLIVKLGVPASGGVGPNSDIVAFSTLCTHVGGDLSGTDRTYLKDHKILGPCPLHLTTFDLRRHGMVVAGHATQSLPQVVLEADGNDIYATGVLGLIYGKRDSADPPALI